ncbi:hypothetical protein [Clostridium sp. C8-1-8]|jgi:hypothetical protein|nr:hypothetical protein [Clostridium sp. C8-1-8]
MSKNSQKSKNQSMADKSEQSRSSQTGFLNRGNSGLNQENQNTKNKR